MSVFHQRLFIKGWRIYQREKVEDVTQWRDAVQFPA